MRPDKAIRSSPETPCQPYEMEVQAHQILKTPILHKKILRTWGLRGVLPARPQGRINFIPIRPWPTQ